MLADIIVYTDGGCSGNPGPGGWAAIILLDNMTPVELSGGTPDTTNNRMELEAVIRGLSYLCQQGLESRSIKVITDSQYVKNGINTWILDWKINNWRTKAKKAVKNKDLWLALDQLNEELRPDWEWVKGHSGNKYNEICDQLVAQERSKYK